MAQLREQRINYGGESDWIGGLLQLKVNEERGRNGGECIDKPWYTERMEGTAGQRIDPSRIAVRSEQRAVMRKNCDSIGREAYVKLNSVEPRCRCCLKRAKRIFSVLVRMQPAMRQVQRASYESGGATQR